MVYRFRKYSALGNDYLVQLGSEALDPKVVREACRGRADGVLASSLADPNVLQIWNSDGSLAEKSGNGLRIFARFMWDEGRIGAESFSISTAGGEVRAQVLDDGNRVRVEMGRVTFGGQQELPRGLIGHIASVGNPHCVCLVEDPTESLARELGPKIETMACFPQRTNVQFVNVCARNELELYVWERGSGYTLSSGTSAVAASAVCHQLGYVDAKLMATMPGGALAVTLNDKYDATIEGPVERLNDVELGLG